MRVRLMSIKARSSEDGLSLIEVIVAMMIFAMLVVGIGYALINVLQMTRDSQARETAISLASSELDAVRAIGDPLAITDDDYTRTVGSNTYTISRTAKWVDPEGEVATCGTGGSTLKYKSVSVEVSWAGMRTGAGTVKTDTALVPSTRINDPTKGTILVSVIDGAGLGVEGVAFTAVSSGGSLDTTKTNSDGCSFIFGVEPGDYTVTLSGSGYIDVNQMTSPSFQSTVEAGSSAKFSFQYDKQGTYQVNYASNDLDAVRPRIPNDLTTTFYNASGVYTMNVPTSGLAGSVNLYPAKSGYEVVAGSYVPPSESGTACESVDPMSWAPDTTKDPATVGTRAPTAFTTPGGIADVTPVPMGIVNVKGNKYKAYLTAVSQTSNPVPGQPVCGISTKYTFGYSFSTSSDSTLKIALPFGTWQLYESNMSTTLGSHVGVSDISLVTPGLMVGTDGTFVLDPRGVTP